LLLIGLASLAVGLCLPDVPLPEWVAIALVLVWMIEVAVMVGLLHGVLITQLGLQPFVVTLCGLLSYRGLARWLTGDSTQGFGTSYVGLKTLVSGLPCRLTLLLAAVGVGLVAWGGWRAIAQRRSPGAEPPLVAHVTLIAVGLILAVTSGLGHLGLGGSPGPAEATLTQRAWFDCGVAGLLLGGIVLSLAALRGRRWWALASEGIAVVGAVTVCLVRTWLPQCGAGLLGRWPQVLAVTAGLAAAMAGGVWFVRSLWRDAGLAVRSTVFVTLAAGLFALAALTPLARVRVPAPFLLLVVLAVLSAVFLNLTIYGRYLLALGRNEAAARYSGVNTKAMICMAYVLCAGLTGVGGILFALEINAIQPAGHGNFYELYAIAGAVLGGCSLRGGEGSIVGVVIGTAVLRVLYNAINMLGVPTQLEFAFIGGVILAGAIVDEILKRLAEQQARRQV
jgi:ribose/xylose/arabinose/galactoside ABC-type transport system permease subunit